MKYLGLIIFFSPMIAFVVVKVMFNIKDRRSARSKY
jgi:hypothetical protein